ncbi:MAG: hypothetical protein Q7R41_17055 [Phycisphaerales bacterium]|nr:hypothetical protein [Phycisphaerales bacterium]
MYKRLMFASVALALAGSPSNVRAELFDFGSDGSFGPINVADNATLTVDLPPDGIINATTVTVGTNGILKFNRNPLNTPVYLLATGNVLVRGRIDVSGNSGTSNPPTGGRGGPGGFDGGMPGFGPAVPPGAGHGPGAGLGQTATVQAGLAAYGPVNFAARPTNGLVYGSPSLIPMVGGSGGGGTLGQPGTGGMGGGGAILIASNTRIDIPSPGSVLANGGLSGCQVNEGSGGAIRLLAPVVAGNGMVQVTSGNCNAGGFGRIRIDSIDRTALQLNFQPNSSTTSVGSTMFVFPDVVPRLDIVAIDNALIIPGAPATILLAFGSTPSRTVFVRATHFTGVVPIDVVLTPDNGDRVVYPAEINVSQGDLAVNVEVPINSITRVEVWTR